MNAPRRDAKWWGWGDPSIAPELDGPALDTLREHRMELGRHLDADTRTQFAAELQKRLRI